MPNPKTIKEIARQVDRNDLLNEVEKRLPEPNNDYFFGAESKKYRQQVINILSELRSDK